MSGKLNSKVITKDDLEFGVKFIGYIALVSFILLIATSIYFGGDAQNGYVHDGVYYLSSHGKDTPVNKEIWYISLILANASLVTIPLTIIGNLLLKPIIYIFKL